jgi:hypothetical protein
MTEIVPVPAEGDGAGEHWQSFHVQFAPWAACGGSGWEGLFPVRAAAPCVDLCEMVDLVDELRGRYGPGRPVHVEGNVYRWQPQPAALGCGWADEPKGD